MFTPLDFLATFFEATCLDPLLPREVEIWSIAFFYIMRSIWTLRNHAIFSKGFFIPKLCLHSAISSLVWWVKMKWGPSFRPVLTLLDVSPLSFSYLTLESLNGCLQEPLLLVLRNFIQMLPFSMSAPQPILAAFFVILQAPSLSALWCLFLLRLQLMQGS